MKKLFLSIAILASISLTTTVAAQEVKKGGKRGADIQKELNLSDDQQKQMQTARADFKAKFDELRSNKDLSKEDRATKMKELNKERETALNNILTPEQQAKMKEMKPRRGDRKMTMRNKKDGRDMKMRAQRGTDRMKDLDLTDEQKAKIKSLNEDFRTKSRELAKQHREDLNKVYTPEQQEKLKEFRKDFNKDGRFAFHGRKGMNRLDEASKDKLKSLRENYMQDKKAVELSRIAPDAQKQKIADLRQNYRKEKQQVIKEARNKAQENKPA